MVGLTTENAEKTQSTQRESLTVEEEKTEMLFEHGIRNGGNNEEKLREHRNGINIYCHHESLY
jgi:hypothetical protein